MESCQSGAAVSRWDPKPNDVFFSRSNFRLRQPTYQDCQYRVVGEVRNTDLVMNNLFWVGVYPGLTPPMLNFTARAITEFIVQAKVRRGEKQPTLAQLG